MHGYRELSAVPTREDIGIVAIPLFAVSGAIAGARVNNRDISEDADFDFLRRETADRQRSSGLSKELLGDERSVRLERRKSPARISYGDAQPSIQRKNPT
jgi:hypothetical protein